MPFQLKLDAWPRLSADARQVRTEVFVIEQNIPIELEWDEQDATSLHAVAYDENNRPIGTGRLLQDGHIGRMAVLRPMRGLGVGAALLTALMQAARERGDPDVVLNAQITAQSFYARFGFQQEGNEFMDAGIPHILMRYKFA